MSFRTRFSDAVSRLRLTVRSTRKRAAPSSFASIVTGALVGASVLATSSVVFADDAPHPQHYPWSHYGAFSAFDVASIRRGFEVYRQVCSTCHSLEFKSYRELIGASHTEEQAKALARSIEVTDGPNEQGEMYQRPGKLFDKLPKPYPNAEYAAFINGGAVPPDLTLMILARHGGEDYVFSLLNGYCDPPEGFELRSGLNYNTYFPGNAIAMAPPLSDGQVEYEDGTPATVSQMSKDVVTFLSWCAQPEHDERKKSGIKLGLAVFVLAGLMGYNKRLKWSIIKTKRVSYEN